MDSTNSLNERFKLLQKHGAYQSYAPSRTLHDKGTKFINQPSTSTNTNFTYMPNSMLTAPFTMDAYRMNEQEEDRVYGGTYIDSQGVEHHYWEEKMPDPETDEPLQPEHVAMDRMLEIYSGGINNAETQKHLGIKNFKPEDNNMISQHKGVSYLKKKFGAWNEIRQYDERRAIEESRRRMENNFNGFNQSEGGPANSIGIHSLNYTKDYSHTTISGHELNDKGYMPNPTAITALPGIRTRPTQYQRQTNHNNWHSSGIGGHTFAMRDINQYPGDKDAYKYEQNMKQLNVNVILS